MQIVTFQHKNVSSYICMRVEKEKYRHINVKSERNTYRIFIILDRW